MRATDQRQPNTEMARANGYTWNIDRHLSQGYETYVWTVLDPGVKAVASGIERSHAAALRAAMRIIRQLEHAKKPNHD